MKENVSIHFDVRASSFDTTPWVKDPQINTLYRNLLPNRPGQLVLDAGGGTGTLIEYLRQSHYETEFVCADISSEMLRHACPRNITSILADISQLPFKSASFDHIIIRQVLHYLTDVGPSVRECRRVIRPGGEILLGQFVPFNKEDKEWMWEILKVRQPLRQNFLSIDEIVDLLHVEGFSQVNVNEVTVIESLDSWLKTYRAGEPEKQTIWNRFNNAVKNGSPRFVQSSCKDLIFENRFALVLGTK